MKRFLIVVGLLIVAFASAYVPSQLRLRDLRESSDQTRQDLDTRLRAAEERYRVVALAGALGMVLIDVSEENFGSARQRSTAFFDQLRDAVATTSDQALKERLTVLLKRRDEITAVLIASKPEAAGKIRELFKELHGTLSSAPVSR